jgi:Calx-beta domain
MNDRGRSRRRAVGRFAIGGFAGAFLMVLGFAPSAYAAPVSHFSINNVGLTEGNAGTTNLTFTISYTGTSNTISVDWATANGTATAPADYTASSGTASFIVGGPTSRTITVPVVGDLLDEANETFTVNLTNPQPPATADITTATGTGTITDDDPTPSLVINDVSLTEGNSGTANAGFAVTLSAPSGRTVTVNYATANATAVQPGDYTTTSGTLTFAPGEVLKTISVPVVGDPNDETNETYVVNLSGASNATIADTQGLGTVVNDDSPPSISINDVSLTEGNAGTSTLTFTATLSVASGKTVTVAYATADGTAIAPADYTAATGTVTFTAGQVSRPVAITVRGDTLDEFDETFAVNLSGPTNATIADSQGVGTILDNDAAPSISINNVTVTEVDAGTSIATFTATLSAASGKTVTVDYATSDVAAAAPADYTAAAGTLTFAPGATTQPVAITLQGDVLDEANETYRVNLSNPGNATIATAFGTGTITDNDATPSMAINDVPIAEANTGTSNANFTVTLSAPSGQNVTVNYATANATAVQPGDYTTTSGTLTFTPGQVLKTIPVPVVGDVTDEIDETYVVNLSGATNATIADTQGLGTIVNDDTAPSLTINDVSITEGNTGTANVTFTATLSAASGKTVTVGYATADGTATAPADYTLATGTLTFNPGVLTRTFTVAVAGDTRDEFDETFASNLSAPVNATIADAQGVATILDNDPIPTLSINNVTVTEVNTGSVTATFTATLSAASGKTVTVDYATSDVTAAAPADYTAASGTLTFAPGTTTQTIPIAVQGDLSDEVNETYRVTLSNPGNATIAAAIGTGTITDNDAAPSITVNDITATEGDAGTTNAVFTVSVSVPSGMTVTVNYATANGTATQPADYTTMSGTLTFTPGTGTRTISVPVAGDVLDEIDETFVVNLSGATNATIADSQGVATIADDDPAPSLTINDVSLTEGDAGSANMTFTVTASAVSAKTMTVAYATADGTATAPADYSLSTGTLTFTPGQVTRTFTVPVLGDTRDEFDETFVANLSSPVNATIADGQGVGTIVDNDPFPTVSVNSISTVEGDAGSTTATFTVSLSAPSGKSISVDYATADGTASSPADYAAATGTLSFAPGQTTKTVDVTIQGDVTDEFDETFALQLSNLVNVVPGTVNGTGTITDDDAAPTVSISSVTLPEGDAGSTTASLTVTLSAASGKPIDVDYASADVTAAAPSDYAGVSGTLSFAPGQTSGTVDVTVNGDTTYETDETLAVALSAPVNVALGTTPGTAAIVNDDPLPQVSIDDRNVTEGDAGTTPATFTLSLTNPSAFPVSMDVTTSDQTASSPTDFVGVSTAVVFAPGQVSRTVDVLVQGDTKDEFDETFAVDVANPVGVTVADGTGVGTIVDDDAAPLVSIDDVSMTEGDAGSTTATFSVTLSVPSGKPIGVDYATAPGTAGAPSDFTGVSGTLSFTPGQTTETVDVHVRGDVLDEFDETFGVALSNLLNVTAGDVTGTGTIVDDDPLPTVSIGDVTLAEGDTGVTTASLPVTLSAPSGKSITVDYTSADVTATAADHTAVSGTVSFAPGQTSATVDVDIHGDTTYENDETFGVALSNLVNVAPGTTAATGTITNDDPLPQASIDDRSMTEGNAGTTAATFTVSLTNPSAFPVAVDVATSDQTASAPADYTPVTTTVSFAPGEASKTVDVLVQGDVVHEVNETYAVDLTNPAGAGLADATGVGTIVDDDAAPVLDVADVTVTEGDAGDVTASFPVTLTGATQVPVTVDVVTADGTATDPSDYAAVTSTLAFAPGQTSKTVDVLVHGDTTFELGETFTLHLSNAAGATIGIDPGSGTILNDDATPGLTVSDVSLAEGNVGDSIATFTVSIGAPSAFPITVDVATQDGTASQPSDYDTVTAPLTFTPGEVAKTVDVTIHGDTFVEPNETYTVQLSNAAGAGISDGVGTGVIADDDLPPTPPPVDPTASIGDASVAEGDAGATTISFPVTLSRPSAGAVTIDYRTADGSADGGSDYVEASGTVRIEAGDTSGRVDVTVTGDGVVEPDETFGLEITAASGARQGTDGTGTITNDDREVTNLILRAKGRHHHVLSRGRMLHAEPGMKVRVVLLRQTTGGFVPIARTTVAVHIQSRGGVPTGIFTTRFIHQRPGRYVVRAIYRGDETHLPSHARARVRI